MAEKPVNNEHFSHVVNPRFRNALMREPQAVPPIWFMRQAGRYHAHYQALRAKHSFIDLCKDPKLAAQVALGPIEEFDFDVSIMFSDLLFPLEAMGMGLRYDPGPKLDWQLDEKTIKNLRPLKEALPGVEFQKQAAIETRRVLPADKSLIGFVGGPWTLFTYAVEGAHKGGLEKSKRELKLFKPFCNLILPLLRENIRLQIEGGAEIVMIFDTSAGQLSPAMYQEAVVPTLVFLANAFPKKLGYYAKSVHAAHLKDPVFRDANAFAGLGFDHRWDLTEAMQSFRAGFVQGNFDQSLLFLEPDDFKRRLEQYLAPIKKLPKEVRSGWVSGLGHGVLPWTPEKNVKQMVKTIREVMA